MKKLILSSITIIAFMFNLNAQVGIETETIGDGAILDFPDNAVKGILLPRVESSANNDEPVTPKVPGTIVFNGKKVRYYGDGKWETLLMRGTKEVEPYTYEETNAKGAVITDGTGSATPPDGALTLESTARALVLPKVADVTKLPSPKAGMICYDIKSKSLAVFNGAVWAFWK